MAENPAPPGTDNWQAEKARLEALVADQSRQLSGLSNERNAYRQKADAWEKKVGSALGEKVRMDPNTGLPVGVEYGQPATYAGRSPFVGLVEDPGQVDAYIQERLNQAGYLTKQQAAELAQTYASQAVQLANANTHLFLNIRDLTTKEQYKDLGQYGQSALAKKTAEILESRGWGKPVEGAQGWTQWNYAGMDSLQTAADLARIDLFNAQQQAAASTAGASHAQAQAGLSVGQAGAAPSGPKDLSTMSPDEQLAQMNRDVEANARRAGVIV